MADGPRDIEQRAFALAVDIVALSVYSIGSLGYVL